MRSHQRAVPPVFVIPPASDSLPVIEQAAWNDLRDIIKPMRAATAVHIPAFDLVMSGLTVARVAAEAIRKSGLSSRYLLYEPDNLVLDGDTITAGPDRGERTVLTGSSLDATQPVRSDPNPLSAGRRSTILPIKPTRSQMHRL